MSDQTRTVEPRDGDRGKILRFPTPIAETDALVAGELAVPTAPASSAFQRLAAVRRRRGDKTVAGSDARSKPAATRSQPSVSQLVTWLLNLRKGGIGYLYWNAAKLPIEVALVRAARLDDDAIVEVVGHRVLVVEPLHPRAAAAAESGSEVVLP